MLIGLLDTAESTQNNMGLFAALKGDIFHFNKNAVPVLNDIFAKLNSLDESEEKEYLLKMLVISNTGIDMLFHPDTGIIKGEVKKFDKEAFYILYEMTILFLISHFKNVSLERAEKSKELFINTVNRVEECNALWNEVDEFTKSSNKMIDRVVQKVSSYTGELTKDKKSALVSAFRGLVVTFIQAI